ncbi:MAG: hypothetical protein EHM54_04190 [Nitrospiraceae bacterium]|nr:MAG: hypothetical protein EHM54_04190 [Nitrospiraceae bacterium]
MVTKALNSPLTISQLPVRLSPLIYLLPLPTQRRRADTAVVVALLRVEAVALILLGAQVIAELERTADELTDQKLSGFET